MAADIPFFFSGKGWNPRIFSHMPLWLWHATCFQSLKSPKDWLQGFWITEPWASHLQGSDFQKKTACHGFCAFQKTEDQISLQVPR